MVIAILAGMLLPALNSARNRARTISCISQLKQLGVSWTAYSLENKDHLLPGIKDKYSVSPQSPPCQKSGEQNFWSCFFAFECVRTDFSSLTGKRWGIPVEIA